MVRPRTVPCSERGQSDVGVLMTERSGPVRPDARRCGVESGLDVVPWHIRWQQDGDDVSCPVPGPELLADLVAGSAGGDLIEHGAGAGRDDPVPRAGARVGGNDRLDV